MASAPTSEGLSGQDEYKRGVELYRQGRFVEAVEWLGKVQSPDDATGAVARFYQAMAHRAIGVAALNQGQFEVAERHLLVAAKTAGPDADLAKYLASVYAHTRRHQQCADEMEKVVSRKDSPSTARKLAQSLWQVGRQEEALMTLTAGLRRFGDVAELHLQMGLFTAAVEQFDEARVSFLAAIDADCENCDAHYYLALTCSAAGDLPAAVRAFQRAFDLQPDNLLLAHQLALAARTAGTTGYKVVLHLPEQRPREATSEIRHMAAYIVTEPDFIESYLALPPSDIDTELFNMLGNIVRTAIVDHPEYADLRLLCSRICQRLGQRDQAAEHARVALEINPDYARAHIQLGHLLADAGEPDDAIEHLVRATKCGGDWADVHYLIGELMMACDTRAIAGDHYRRALELSPDFRPAAEAILRLAA